MSSDAGSASGNGASGTGSGNSGQADLEAMVTRAVNEALNKAVPAIVARVAPKLVEAHLASVAGNPEAKTETPAAADPANGGGDGKVTMKALQDQLTAMGRKLEVSEKRGQEAELRAKDARLRAEVHAEMQKHLGADSPMVGPLMDSLFGVHRRFDAGEDGRTVVRFKRDGYEEALPLEQGFAELVKGELKPYLPARNGNLPSSGMPARGNPWQQPKPPQHGTGQPTEPALLDIARTMAERRPEVAAALAQVAYRPLPDVPSK